MHQKNANNCNSLQHWKNFRWKIIEVVYVHYILHTFTIWKICVYVYIYIYICTRLNQLHVLFLVHIPTHWWRKDLSRARGNTVIVTAKFRRSTFWNIHEPFEPFEPFKLTLRLHDLSPPHLSMCDSLWYDTACFLWGESLNHSLCPEDVWIHRARFGKYFLNGALSRNKYSPIKHNHAKHQHQISISPAFKSIANAARVATMAKKMRPSLHDRKATQSHHVNPMWISGFPERFAWWGGQGAAPLPQIVGGNKPQGRGCRLTDLSESCRSHSIPHWLLTLDHW